MLQGEGVDTWGRSLKIFRLVAQMEERLVLTQEVVGSNPTRPANLYKVNGDCSSAG